MKLYVTSSFRCTSHARTVALLRKEGYSVFDYREGVQASVREDVHDPKDWNVFETDRSALRCCDALVLLLPGGRGAHLEAGYAAGMGKPVLLCHTEDAEMKPELMYALCSTQIFFTDKELLSALYNMKATRPTYR